MAAPSTSPGRRAGRTRRTGAHPMDDDASQDDAPEPVLHLTVAERRARGKAARSEVSRSSHGGFHPAVGRRDPVDLLTSQAATRVPELVPVRYGRMLVSPFTFYRGGALLMAADLADGPRSGLQ